MARFMDNNSSTSNHLQRFLDKNPQTTVLASCYSVGASATAINGFHYCTTSGAGSKTAQTSPPPDFSVASAVRSGYPVNNLLEHKGEATHTIPGECERLFCDTLSTIFLGERRLLRQQLLGIGASRSQPNEPGYGETQIQRWVEVLDYTSDAIYRGFVTNASGEQTLFVFLTENALGHGLKSGLIALFELASVQAFDCSQIVACVPRSQGGTELELTRNLGWCGFGLTTLHPWATGNRSSMTVSTRWLFLSAEV